MGWGPLGVSAGYRYSPARCRWTQGCTMAEGEERAAGCVARRAGHCHRRSHQTFHRRLASSRGRDRWQHELSPRPCLQPDVTLSLPTPCASGSSRWRGLGTGDGSSACQWVQSAKCEARQSGQPLADQGIAHMRRPCLASNSCLSPFPSHRCEGNWLCDGLLRRNDCMTGSGVAEGFGRKAFAFRLLPERRCWWGQVRRGIPSWPLRRWHCRGGGSSGSQREAPRP